MDIDRIAQFIIKCFGLAYLLRAIGVIYDIAIYIPIILGSHSYSTQVEHEGLIGTIFPMVVDQLMLLSFYLVMAWLLWAGSRSISQFMLKKIK